MKGYFTGVLSGAGLLILIFLLLGAQPAPEDSIAIYVDRLETLLNNEIAKNRDNGRYQLQTVSIDRTHWHYILDTATGDLYRVELSRTPENSKWELLAEAKFSD